MLGQTLQAPLHVEASAQTAVVVDREPELGFNGPETVSVGGFAPLPHGLSRASRTRSASVASEALELHRLRGWGNLDGYTVDLGRALRECVKNGSVYPVPTVKMEGTLVLISTSTSYPDMTFVLHPRMRHTVCG